MPSEEKQNEPTLPGKPLDNLADLTPVVELSPETAEAWGLPLYLFVEALCPRKVVIDLTSEIGPGPEILRRAGALEVLRGNGKVLPLSFPSGVADLVLLGLAPEVLADDTRCADLLAEVRRVLNSEGYAIIRVSAESLEKSSAGTSLRTALMDPLLAHFSTIEMVEETTFAGDSFFVPGCDDLAVSEAITRLAGNPRYLLALCADTTLRPWQLNESLLVPKTVGLLGSSPQSELAIWKAEVARLSQKVAESQRERSELREQNIVLLDRAERLDENTQRLRKEVERYLRQISEDATERELLLLERDQQVQRSKQQDGELERLRWESERLRATVHSLEKEVARLRAARGELASGPHAAPVNKQRSDE